MKLKSPAVGLGPSFSPNDLGRTSSIPASFESSRLLFGPYSLDPLWLQDMLFNRLNQRLLDADYVDLSPPGSPLQQDTLLNATELLSEIFDLLLKQSACRGLP